jgi:hypothetical protein
VLGRRRRSNAEASLVRTLLLALAVTAVLWWLLRPRRSARAVRYDASEEPTYRAVRTFRTPGGVATTVWQATWRNGGPVQRWHSWTCDCGGGVEGYDTLREAAPDAIAHHEAHGR